MLGKTDPKGNGRLALAVVDVLLQRLLAAGIIKESDLDALVAETAARLEAENSITSAGALSILEGSRLGR